MAKAKKPNIWVDDVEEAPRSGLPDARKMRRRMTITRIWVWASVILLPLALLGLVSASGSASSARASADAAALQVRDSSPGQASARATVSSWLSSKPAPLPGGRILMWEGATASEPFAPSDDANSTVTIERNRFILIDRNGIQYRTEVEVAVDSRGGVVVISEPSLIPIDGPINDGWSSGFVWPGLSALAPSEEVVAAVNRWADAFISDDPADLRLAVGDPDGDHSYLPLSGIDQVIVETGQAAALDDNGSAMVVRIRVGILWSLPEGQVHKDEDGNDLNLEELQIDDLATITMDVLVERADTASPVVVAWGGAGSGPSLERYGNAVSGERAEASSWQDINGFPAPDEDSAGDDEDAPVDDETEAPASKETTTTKPAPTTTKPAPTTTEPAPTTTKAPTPKSGD